MPKPKPKNDEAAFIAAFAAMTDEEKHAAFYRAKNNPYDRIISEIESVDTQKEAAEIFALCRDLLQELSPEDRRRVTKEVNKMIDKKPVI